MLSNTGWKNNLASVGCLHYNTMIQWALARIVRQNAGAESAFLARFVCNTLRSFYQLPFSGGMYPFTEAEIGLSPPVEAGGFRAFDNNRNASTSHFGPIVRTQAH